MLYRVSEDEFLQIHEKFMESGVKSYSEFNSQAVLKPRIVPSQELKDLRREIIAIGNNLNQIAKIANASKLLYPDVALEIKELQLSLFKLMKTVF
jgi:hypothetical protein